MKRFAFFLPVIMLFFFLAAAPRPALCAAAEHGGVIAEGMAIKTEEKADYKKKALQDAHKMAVAEAMEKMLSDSAPVARQGMAAVEPRILNNAGSYILTYKVLSEGWLTHSDIEMPAPAAGDKLSAPQAGTGVEAYHVRIEAGVDMARLKSDMVRYSDEGAPAMPLETITVTLVDVPDYKTYSEIMAAIERVGLIKDPVVSSLYRGRVRLTAAAKGGDRAVIERLAKELSEGYAVIPASGGGIIVRVTRKGGDR